MANAHTPGGGYKFGDGIPLVPSRVLLYSIVVPTGAQEENIHRRSNYFQYLEDPEGIFKDRPWCYPIPEFGASMFFVLTYLFSHKLNNSLFTQCYSDTRERA